MSSEFSSVVTEPIEAERKRKRSEYHTRCVTCGERFDSVTKEDKHRAFNPDHCRYELELGPIRG